MLFYILAVFEAVTLGLRLFKRELLYKIHILYIFMFPFGFQLLLKQLKLK